MFAFTASVILLCTETHMEKACAAILDVGEGGAENTGITGHTAQLAVWERGAGNTGF